MDKILFSAFDIIIEEEPANAKDFIKICERPNGIFQYNDKNFDISTERLTNNFYWIYTRFGTAKPYSKDVINEENGQRESNPRNPNQTEPRNQIFSIYDCTSSTFYTSNGRQKNHISSYIGEALDKECLIKNMLCSEEKFLSIVKTIETIKFTKRRNLITSTQHIFSEDIDYFGLGRPDQFNVECDFKGIPITKKFKAALSRVRKKTQQQEFENIICVGKDESQMETIFNLDTLRHKISIQAQADHNGMYDPNEVKELIQKRISNMNKNVPQT